MPRPTPHSAVWRQVFGTRPNSSDTEATGAFVLARIGVVKYRSADAQDHREGGEISGMRAQKYVRGKSV